MLVLLVGFIVNKGVQRGTKCLCVAKVDPILVVFRVFIVIFLNVFNIVGFGEDMYQNTKHH